ncbi:MAG: pilin, partial [Patescibacteria group bacterium]
QCGCEEGEGIICIPDPLECKTIDEIIEAIVTLIVAIGLGVGVIMIIWSAILYMTSAGNEQKVATAKKALMWTVIGIAILLSARFIIMLLVEVLSGP